MAEVHGKKSGGVSFSKPVEQKPLPVKAKAVAVAVATAKPKTEKGKASPEKRKPQ
jgi:hypothetical protein